MRLVIAEDSALFRDGLSRLLEDTGHEIVAAVADADAAQTAVRGHQPDVAVLDVRMPPSNRDDGALAAVVLRREFPTLGLVLLSQRIETRYAATLAVAGYFGYLLKDRVLDVADFLDVLERVRAGGTALDPDVVQALLTAGRNDSRLSALSPREREVLALMAEGRNNVGIARRLVLTERTVETHVGSILAKLGLHGGETDHRRVLAVVTYLQALREGK